MTTYLFIWTVIASKGSSIYSTHNDWRNLGSFESVAACEKAAAKLGYNKDVFRCITVKGE